MLVSRDRDNDVVTVFHCTECCALVPNYSDLPQDTLTNQKDYHEKYWIDEDRSDVLRQARDMQGVVHFYRKYLESMRSSGTILDLGGGRGLLTKALHDLGYDVIGCEPSARLVGRAQTLLNLPEERYRCADIENFLDDIQSNNPIRVAFLWHVIEHLRNPMEILSKISKKISDDGIIIVQGPLLDQRYIFREHLFLHSESNIAWMAKKLHMKIVFLESFSKERYVSFVLAKEESSFHEVNTVYLPRISDAIGSLFFTMSQVIIRNTDQ